MIKINKILPRKNEYLKLFVFISNILIIFLASLLLLRSIEPDHFIKAIVFTIIILNLIGFILHKSFKIFADKKIKIILYLITSLFVIFFSTIIGRLIYFNFDNERLIDTSSFFLSEIKDTQKLNHLNVYCIKDAIEKGEINYVECIESNKNKGFTQQVLPNLDSSKNIGSYMEDGDETWIAHLADYLPKGEKNTGIYIYEIAVNTGGTGYFSSIDLFQLYNNNILEYLGSINGGDRCNDGNLEYIASDDQGITYATSATPFRLLNYKDTTNWRGVSSAHLIAKIDQEDLSLSDYAKSINLPSFFHDIEPYEDIDNSAQGCVGNIVRLYQFDKDQKKMLGLIINKSFLKDNISSSESGHACFDKWKIKHQFSKYTSYKEDKDSIYMESEDWDDALASFQNYCSARINPQDQSSLPDCGIDIGPVGQGGKEYCTGNIKIDDKIRQCYEAKSTEEHKTRSKELVAMGEYKTVDEVPWNIGVAPGVRDHFAEQCFDEYK